MYLSGACCHKPRRRVIYRKEWVKVPTGYSYFTIEAASGGYRAHFYGANDVLVWWTEVYVRKEGAQQAIAFAKVNASGAPTKDRS
jgi:uncharacterized protein YegP (UPF0339 family)